MDRRDVTRDLLRGQGSVRLQLDDLELSVQAGALAGSNRLFSDAMGNMPIHDILLAHTMVDFGIGDLKARAYWYGARADIDIELDLRHPQMNLTLGTLPTLDIAQDTAHLEAQYDWRIADNNLLLLGADVRLAHLRSDQFVESVTEVRGGFFLHDEHRFGDRFLVAASARLDINTRTDLAISPRLALIFNPAGDHFIRLSGGTAFRKPTLVETSARFRIEPHPSFPEIQTLFEVNGISNPDLDNEVLSTVELGYRGSVSDGDLRFWANAYFSYNTDFIELVTDIRFTEFFQIDLSRTHLGYVNIDPAFVVVGGGLSIEGEPTPALTLFARGDYRREWYLRDDGWDLYRDQLLAAIGGIGRLPGDLTLHLAVMFAGEYVHDFLRDPATVLADSIMDDIPGRSYLFAALRHRLHLGRARMDLGLSWFNPFGARFREKLGVLTLTGGNFGGEVMGSRLMLTARFVH